MKLRECDNCKELTQKKFLGKINGKYYCKKCRSEIRKNHREETIDSQGIREDLKKLKNRYDQERGYAKKAYAKKMGRPIRSYGKGKELPKIKGSKLGQPKQTNDYCFLNPQERNLLYESLIRRGLDSKKAGERIKDLIESQENLRNKLKQQNKSEKEIKIKQKELLEELWNY